MDKNLTLWLLSRSRRNKVRVLRVKNNLIMEHNRAGKFIMTICTSYIVQGLPGCQGYNQNQVSNPVAKSNSKPVGYVPSVYYMHINTRWVHTLKAYCLT